MTARFHDNGLVRGAPWGEGSVTMRRTGAVLLALVAGAAAGSAAEDVRTEIEAVDKDRRS